MEKNYIEKLGIKAKEAKKSIANASTAQKNKIEANNSVRGAVVSIFANIVGAIKSSAIVLKAATAAQATHSGSTLFRTFQACFTM